MNKSSGHFFICRESGELKKEVIAKERLFNWFYTPGFGRLTSKVFFHSKLFHQVVKWYCESRFSKPLIKKLIRAGNINLNEAEWPLKEYKTLNEFFIRRLKANSRPIESQEGNFISPGDGKLLVRPIADPQQVVIIKGVYMALSDLLVSNSLADRYIGGQIAILRLYLGDYHRFHFPVTGFASTPIHIPGRYSPVTPFQRNKENFYSNNHRVLCKLSSSIFGLISVIPVGGFLISSIKLKYNPGYVRKGEEQGYFAFGGSTLIWLTEKGKLDYDDDILNNSQSGIETFVKFGSQIASVKRHVRISIPTC